LATVAGANTFIDFIFISPEDRKSASPKDCLLPIHYHSVISNVSERSSAVDSSLCKSLPEDFSLRSK